MAEADDRTIVASDEALSDDTIAVDPAELPQPSVIVRTEVAPRIGRYSILRKLGAGGMGVVFAGFDEELDRKVAIKLMLGRESAARRQRLQREAQGLARLSHPNVVQVYEIGEHEGAPYIAMEFVDGHTLGDWLEMRRPSRREILAVFLAAGHGLAAAHEKDLVHRDFKPDNVMIASDGRVLVMDFGLVHEAGTSRPPEEVREEARRVMSQSQVQADALERSLRSSALSSDLTATGAMMGTPAYMAPEQFAGWQTDARSDQFSFCVALWEALCGERPFAGESIAELCAAVTGGQRREPPRSANLPAYLRKILVRGLATNPKQRWPSMSALLAELSIDRTRRRLLVLAIGVPLLASVAGLLGWQHEQRAEQAERVAACEAAGQAITELWNDDTRARIEASFAATKLEFASDAWQKTHARLDDYASKWSAQRVASCRSATLEHTRSEVAAARVDACLSERLAAFRSLLAVLEQADAELIPRAIQAAAGLPLLGPCNDDAWLAHRVELPADPRARERIAELRSRIEHVEVLLATARFEQAQGEAEVILSEAETLGWAPLVAEARYARALVLERRDDLRTAEAELERAFFGAGEAGHDLLALRAAISLTDVVGDELERPDEGLRWGRIAEMLLERLDARGSVEEGLLAIQRGSVLEARGSYAEAQREHERAQELYGAVFGPEHPNLAAVLNNIGIVQRRQGQLEAALATQTRALALREATLGPDHPAVGDTSTNMANILFDLGRSDEALTRSRRALEIWRKALGERHQKIGYALNSIGNAHFARQELDLALEHYRQALEVWEAALGLEHSTSAMALTNIGNVLFMKGELDEALLIQQQALARSEAALGPDHISVAEKLNNVAVVLVALGRLDEALALSRRSLVIREASVGPEALETAFSLQNVGSTLTELGRPREAREYLERALSIREAGAVDPLLLAEIRFELGRTLWALKERERADELVDAALESCRAAENPCAQGIEAWRRERAR